MNSLSVADYQFLLDPNLLHSQINIDGMEPKLLLGFLENMLRIRVVERILAEKRREGLIGGPVHLGVGQEAVAVGVSATLTKSDRVFGAHRSHSHLLALGSDMFGLFAEVLGKDAGLSKGMGGSMHLWDQPNGFYGSVPIVAGTVPLAVGAGLAAKMQGVRDVGVAYFGDGAVEEGVVHESLNLASLFKLPVLFVVENNLFASHMHISLRQPNPFTARFAAANDIQYEVVDGNDVVAVARAAERLVQRAREGAGPGFLEAITYRWYGHVDWRDDIDVGVERSVEHVSSWRARDPVKRLAESLMAIGVLDEGRLKSMESALEESAREAWLAATHAPYPDAGALLDRVYAK